MTLFPSEATAVQSDEWKYDGISGWLVLVAIGLSLAPILQLVFVFTTLVPIFTNGSWEVLTSKASPAYHPLWAPVIALEAVMNVGLFCFEIVLLILMFRRRRLFPKLMISYLLAAFVLIGIDYFMAQGIPAVAEENDPQSRVTFMRAGLACAIWIPYFMRSKRVRATFRR